MSRRYIDGMKIELIPKSSFERSPVAGLALPHDQYTPTQRPQGFLIAGVSFHVTLKLVQPKILVGFGCRGVLAAGVAVPIAAVDENDRFMFG